MNCEVCRKSFSGPICYQQHLESDKHKKKVSQQCQYSGIFHSAPGSGKCEDTKNAAFFCDVCQIFYYDVSSYMIHVSSLEHADTVKNYHRNKENKISKLDTAGASQNLDSQIEISSSKEEPLLPFMQNPVGSYNYCQPCNKRFSGPEPYRQHIVSKAHLKMTNSSVQVDDNKLSDIKCDTCDKKFSGPVPYDQHLKSEIHKKKLYTVNLLLQLKNNESPLNCGIDSTTDSVSKNAVQLNIQENNNKVFAELKCNICDKHFSGPVPYNDHLKSEVHKKTVNSKYLLLQLEHEDSPQNCSVSSTDSVPKHTMQNPLQSLNSANVNDPWYCGVCKVRCSGVEPYNAHMVGSNHKKKLKMAELEEQFGNSPLNTSDQRSEIFTGSEKFITKHTAYATREDPDAILPELECFESLSLENLNVTFFRPNEKLNFNVEHKINNLGEIKIQSSEIYGDYEGSKNDQEVKRSFYICEICDVNLHNTEEVACHFESTEHIKMKSFNNANISLSVQ